MKKVFVIADFVKIGERIYRAICNSASEAGNSLDPKSKVECYRLDQLATSGRVTDAIHKAINDADTIIVDISDPNPNIMYELGYAQALAKPTIILRRGMKDIPFDIASEKILIHGSLLSKTEMENFMKNLTKTLVFSLAHPDDWLKSKDISHKSQQTVFISYSHTDTKYLRSLQVHLRPLEKNNLIDLWDDTKIRSGAKWKVEIENALARASIAVLLISADFLASDFIVDNELPPLLKNAEEKGTTILPVILKPCRFLRDPNLSQFQAINDPQKPLQSMTDAEQENIYAMICERIELELSR